MVQTINNGSKLQILSLQTLTNRTDVNSLGKTSSGSKTNKEEAAIKENELISVSIDETEETEETKKPKKPDDGNKITPEKAAAKAKATDPATRDGVIETTKQGYVGDCWLLSGTNALSYIEKGREFIQQALQHDENGTNVHFEGVGDYYITAEELAKKQESGECSSGDIDMQILEIAAEKARNDVLNDKIVADDDTYAKAKESIWGGNSLEMIFYLTGKTGEMTKDDEEKEKILEKFTQSIGKDYVMTAGTGTRVVYVKDVDGKKTKIAKNHMYAVKRADKDTVTVINPWGSDKEITLPIKSFLKAFPTVMGCDLSDNNPTKKSAVQTESTTEELSDGGKLELIKSKDDGSILRKIRYDKDGNKTLYKKYSLDGKLQQKIKYTKEDDGTEGQTNVYYHEDGKTPMVLLKQRKNGDKLVSGARIDYYEDGSVKSKLREEHTDGKSTKRKELTYAKDGRLKESDVIYKYKNGELKNITKTYEKNGSYSIDTSYDYKDGSSKSFIKEYDKEGVLKESYADYINADEKSKSVYTKYDKDGKVIYRRYEYIDGDGNLIKTEIDKDGDGKIDKVKK